jgi:hypothetical protein
MKNVPEIEFTSKEALVTFIENFRYNPPPGNEEGFIIVKNVTKKDMAALNADRMFSKLRCNYYSNEHVLVIESRASKPHEVMASHLEILLREKVSQQADVNMASSRSGSCELNGFWFEPDSSLQVRDPARDLPNIVIEVGFTQNMQDLHRKAAVYFSGNRDVNNGDRNAKRLVPRNVINRSVKSLADRVRYHVRVLNDDSPFHRSVNLVVLGSYERNENLIIEWWARSFEEPNKGIRVGVVSLSRESGDVAVGIQDFNERNLRRIPPATWTISCGETMPSLVIPAFFFIGRYNRPDEPHPGDINLSGRDFIEWADLVYFFLDKYKAKKLANGPFTTGEGIRATNESPGSSLQPLAMPAVGGPSSQNPTSNPVRRNNDTESSRPIRSKRNRISKSYEKMKEWTDILKKK